jgi:transcriptional regulator
MTIRKKIIALLTEKHWTARELSKVLHIAEKDVCAHLEHVGKTLKNDFSVQPPECLSCGFVFSSRMHIRCPSRCPRCKSEHIQEPAFFSQGSSALTSDDS